MKGRVVERWSGQPVAGAVVMIGDRSAIAGADGYFTIDVPDGPALITAIHMGYETLYETVELRRDSEIVIVMTPIVRAL